MTLVCVVCGSQNREVKRMFPFPTELDKLRIWQQNMGIKHTEESFRNYRICDRHFEKDCYHSRSYRLRLGAVPTLYPCVPIHSRSEVPKECINAPMEDFELGSCFESYEELMSKLSEYCNAINTKFVKKDARRVSAKLTKVNQRLIYSELKFHCVHNGISTSNRKSRDSNLECPAYFRLKMIDSGTALQIIALNNNHNHPTEEKRKVTRQKEIEGDDDGYDEVWRFGEPTEILSRLNDIEIDTDEIWPFEETIKSVTRQEEIERDYEFWQYQRPAKTLPKQILVNDEKEDDEEWQLDGSPRPMPQHIQIERDDDYDELCQPQTIAKQKEFESDDDVSQFEDPTRNASQHIEIERDDDESWHPTDTVARQKEIQSDDDDEVGRFKDPIKNHEVQAYKRKRPIIEENVKRIRLQIERDIGFSDEIKQVEFIDVLIDQDSEPNVNFTFRGLCAPVFTVFNKDLTVNVEIIPKYAKFLADNGIKAVLVHGTSGEGMSMTVTERKSVAEEWIKAAKSTKQHVMVQVGGCPLPDVLELTKHAESIGVDSLLCLPELYFKPSTPSQLISYLKIVGEAAPKTPLLYYHIPGWTGVNINMAQFLNESVGKIPTFHGIKYTSNDLDGGAAALRANDGKYAVFLGADTLLAGAFAMGFDSAIATSFNMLPQYGVQILEAIKESNVGKAQALQKKLSTACSVITKDGAWVPTMKVAMNIITPLNVGLARPPLTNLTDEEANDMERSLKAASLF